MRSGSKTSLVIILAASILSGCAPSNMRFVSNNNVTQDQFIPDSYACYQETQQKTSAVDIEQYDGAVSGQAITSCSAFNACLAARGYYRSDTTNLADFQTLRNFFVQQGAVKQCSQ